LKADIDLAKRETKRTVKVHEQALKKSANKLNQKDKANQRLRLKLNKNQHALTDVRVTHSSCVSILADYQRIKRRWVRVTLVHMHSLILIHCFNIHTQVQ